MIKFITSSQVLDIRNEVLREGKLTPQECRFATDDLPGSFHLGCFEQDKLIGIASFHLQTYPDRPGTGYQLRGMASLPQYQGTGAGSRLLGYAIEYLQQQNADYIWCNARKKALVFYRRLGFNVVSDEFDVPGIGPHYAMYLPLKQSVANNVV